MKIKLIGKTEAVLFDLDGMPGKAAGSEFEARVQDDTWDPMEASEDGGQQLIEFAGRLCYESFDLPNPVTESNSGYIRNIVSLGHESVLEHASVTFYVEGVSRSLSHELIRHRHLSFSELSQRYVNMEDARYVIPPAYRKLEGWDEVIPMPVEYVGKYEHNSQVLKDAGLNKKQSREAARASLPNATETKLVVTGNLRAWRDVLKKRLSSHADAEMQLFAWGVFDILKQEYPDVFADIEYQEK